MWIPRRPHSFYMPCPSYSPWLDHSSFRCNPTIPCCVMWWVEEMSLLRDKKCLARAASGSDDHLTPCSNQHGLSETVPMEMLARQYLSLSSLLDASYVTLIVHPFNLKVEPRVTTSVCIITCTNNYGTYVSVVRTWWLFLSPLERARWDLIFITTRCSCLGSYERGGW
jgi:hypothetical protein